MVRTLAQFTIKSLLDPNQRDKLKSLFPDLPMSGKLIFPEEESYTLTDLWKLLPDNIEDSNFRMEFDRSYWDVGYYTYAIPLRNRTDGGGFKAAQLIDAVFDCIVWLKSFNYI